MERLILKYVSTDYCTYSFDVVLPFTYESKDKALFDLELALDEYIKTLSQNIKDNALINNRINILKSKKNISENEKQEMQELFIKLRHKPKSTFQLGSLEISLDDFCNKQALYEEERKYSGHSISKDMPEVLTLDEWYK